MHYPPGPAELNKKIQNNSDKPDSIKGVKPLTSEEVDLP